MNLDFGDLFPEGLSLNGGNLKLESGRLARAVTVGEGASAPGGSYDTRASVTRCGYHKKDVHREHHMKQYSPPWTSVKLLSWPKALL